MSVGDLGSDGAGAVIRARLGRPPQDMLEAAVVLEAWGGLPAEAALRLGPRVLLPALRSSDPRRWRPADAEGRSAVVSEGVALLIAILAIAAWAGPLSSELGSNVFEHALRLALPVTLALQWALRSRYLSRRAGLVCVAEDWLGLTLVLVAVEACVAAVPGFGPVAAMLVAVWGGGTVLTRRGWALGYAGLLIAESIGLALGLPALASLAVLTVVTLAMVVVAVATATGAAIAPPGRLSRALAAGVIGGLLGGLLVGDPSLGWGIHGAFPALALVPSVVGSFWGGYHLWQFHQEIPRSLRGVELSRASASMVRGPATDIVLAALARLIGITVILSLLVMFVSQWTSGTDATSLFVAFGCAALVCMFVSLLESLGYVRWALLSAAASLAAELAVSRWLGDSIAGAGLIAGGVVGTLLALAPLVGLLRFPGRVLATALWIQ
ncbi:hypothetical protein [Conexibacter woesei]|uniref:Uncharacterized protein n=1 Tax=Conexibacter woesei (strain DSM 14684 / CCUG 47730 / CIP 108061 / JCM 11494 / NBRC 100937 / ID131577) TaxID=469383 RepID=D3F8I8_CONWI|nr:hypothetical protein [Conexibacter woesei]ADB50952.1 hypothetical protein Cwoe_2530 [Conexibacter woesei DSM 14684]